MTPYFRLAAICLGMIVPAAAAATECLPDYQAPPPATGGTGGTGGAGGAWGHLGSTRNPEGISALDADFRDSLAAMFAAASAELGGQMTIYSGYRSVEEQTRLWEAELERVGGDPEKADDMVARPGSSNHNFGRAVDVNFNGSRIDTDHPDYHRLDAWMNANLERFGLHRPMADRVGNPEDWHIEPVSTRGGAAAPGGMGQGDGRSQLGVTPDGETCVFELPNVVLMPWESPLAGGVIPAGALCGSAAPAPSGSGRLRPGGI